MTQDEVITEVDRQFGNLPRPAMFIRGSCKCQECLEHESALQSFVPNDLPLEKLDNPGWDPICFASPEAFGYLMPGLVRLVLNHAEDYVSQFLFHLNSSERISTLSFARRRSLVQVLECLALNHAEALDNNLAVDDLNDTKEKLEQPAPDIVA